MREFSDALLAWYDANARDLPWRGESDPYRIWISEIMLQQTRAETVKGYYHRFLQRFPDVQSLAEAQEDDVFKLWEGLGYYSRARNLMAAAKQIVTEWGSQLPCTRRELMRLPGIGEYVSGAVASIAFGLREPALDGNQARVLTRIWDYDRLLKSPAELYESALEWVPAERPGDYNQALMGLGALICTPTNPKCPECPVKQFCRALENGTQQERPVKPQKAGKPEIPMQVAVVWNDQGILMRKRGRGLLSGLWEYPNFENARTQEDAAEGLRELGIEAEFLREIGAFRHVFTHKIWQMQGWSCRLVSLAEDSPFALIPWEEYHRYAIPTAFRLYTEFVKKLPVL